MEGSLIVKDAKVDKEHDDILRSLNRHFSSLEKLELINLVKELYEYTIFHFIDEEGFMIVKKMPKDYIEFHEKEHEQMRNEIKSFVKNINDFSKSEILSYIEYYKQLLISHINNIDSQMNNYLE